MGTVRVGGRRGDEHRGEENNRGIETENGGDEGGEGDLKASSRVLEPRARKSTFLPRDSKSPSSAQARANTMIATICASEPASWVTWRE